jgi:hypothetical protein
VEDRGVRDEEEKRKLRNSYIDGGKRCLHKNGKRSIFSLSINLGGVCWDRNCDKFF